MAYETITVARADGVATIALNRPDRLNALSLQLIGELTDAARDAGADPAVRCLVLTGSGRAFSSGADLSSRGTGGTYDPRITLRNHYNPLMELLTGLDKPVISAVNGPCAGAGVGIALAADFVLAAQSAYFLLAFVNIGLVPDAGSTWTVPKLVGRQRALAMALLGERLPAAKAAEWGLIWEAVPDAELAARTTALAQRLAGGPTKAYGLIRRALRASEANDLSQQLALEADLQAVAARSPDHIEGVKAFLEKRPARFTGE